jgi:AAA15 family ATPase/GTPase
MKIKQLAITNYRTLEAVNLEFPSSYTAICGRNDSGKTNVVRAIRAIIKEDSGITGFIYDGDEDKVSIKDDYPKWKEIDPSKREIRFQLVLTVQRERDAGLFQFLLKQLTISTEETSIDLTMAVTYRSDSSDPEVRVKHLETEYRGLEAQEVWKRLQFPRPRILLDTEL